MNVNVLYLAILIIPIPWISYNATMLKGESEIQHRSTGVDIVGERGLKVF
jgi:hypothetical protein